MEEHGRYGVGNEGRGYKSKAEVHIARMLENSGIAYNYEHPLAVVDGGRVRIWYPDFYLPEYGMIIEYFDVNGDTSYDERKQHKLEAYRQAGIEGVFLTNDSLKGDWPTKLLSQIEDVLKGRIKRFYNRRCADV
jgi:hypothetical protein